MKKQSKLLTVGLMVALVFFFSGGTAKAAFMANATIAEIIVTAEGDYHIKGVSGNWIKWFNILASDPNAKAILASILTCKSLDEPITIQYTGNTVEAVYLKGP